MFLVTNENMGLCLYIMLKPASLLCTTLNFNFVRALFFFQLARSNWSFSGFQSHSYTFSLLLLPATPLSSLLLPTHPSRPSLYSFTADHHQANSFPWKAVLLKRNSFSYISIYSPLHIHYIKTSLRPVKKQA